VKLFYKRDVEALAASTSSTSAETGCVASPSRSCRTSVRRRLALGTRSPRAREKLGAQISRDYGARDLVLVTV
jgi:hypothetical protein